MTFLSVGTDDFQNIVTALTNAKARDFVELIQNKLLIPQEPGFYMFSSDENKNDVLYIGMSTCLRNRFTEYKYTGSTHPGRTASNLLKVRQINYLTHGKKADRLYLTYVVYKNLSIEKRLIEKYRPRYDIRSEQQIGKILNDALKAR